MSPLLTLEALLFEQFDTDCEEERAAANAVLDTALYLASQNAYIVEGEDIAHSMDVQGWALVAVLRFLNSVRLETNRCSFGGGCIYTYRSDDHCVIRIQFHPRLLRHDFDSPPAPDSPSPR